MRVYVLLVEKLTNLSKIKYILTTIKLDLKIVCYRSI